MRRFAGWQWPAAVLAAMWAALGAGGPAPAPEGSGPAGKPPAPAAVFGANLVKRLLEDKTRLGAFRELVRHARNDPYKALDSAEVIVCPPAAGRKPVYVVLTNYRWRSFSSYYSTTDYSVENPYELFGPPPEAPEKPIPPHGRLEKRGDLVIYAFAEDGREIRPFGGYNLLFGGMIADINGDGFVERVDYINCRVEGVQKVQVLEISAVHEESRPLLTVLYNWGDKADWDYQFADRDNDGVIEIEFGPVVGQGAIKPKAVFTWSREKSAYVGPEGKQGAHFRVLPQEAQGRTDIWAQFRRLKEDGLTFPADPEATGSAENGHDVTIFSTDSRRQEPAPPAPRPYKRVSLNGLENQQVAAYMGEGKRAYQFELERLVRTQKPKGFWESPARQAALAMAEINRTDEHRQSFRLAIDGRDGKKPPDECLLYYSYRSRRCYTTSDSKYLLRVDPRGSYLARSTVSGLGVVFYDLVEARPAYDLCCVSLGYDDARHLAQVIWWLNRVRTWSDGADDCFRDIGSSADGSSAIRMTWGQGEEIRAVGTWWSGPISERWTRHYGPEVFLNMADHLIQVALPERLGKPTAGQEQQQEEGQVGRLIGVLEAEPSELALPILLDTVHAIGDSLLTQFAPQLRAMQRRLPPPDRPVPTTKAVEEKWLDRQRAGDNDASQRLYEQVRALEHGMLPESAKEELRQAVELSIRKIDAAGNPDVLFQWVRSGGQGWQQALQRLRQVDEKRYAEALEWLLHNTQGKWTRQVFAAIERANPERARELAATMPPGQSGDLAVSAFAILDKAKAIEDPAARIDALIQVAMDPGNGWEERAKAIDCLVPRDAPLKYPDRKIDEALVRLLNPQLADKVVNFTVEHACRALALRGRIEYFEKVVGLLEDGQITDTSDRIVASAVSLAQAGGPEHRARLCRVLASNLRNTNRNISAIALAVYALNLRELRGDLENIATAGPEDYEGARAYSRGGEVTPVTGRFHMPRRILAIWDEEDRLTRAKLLVTFCLNHEADCAGMARRTMRTQLKELVRALSPEEARQAFLFADWCARTLPYNGYGESLPEDGLTLAEFLKNTFEGRQ